MNRLNRKLLNFAFLPVLLSTLAYAAPDTQEQLQALFDAGQYQQVLPKLNQAIALKGPAAAKYDHYKLLLLKAETQLRIPPGKSAVEAFKAAAKAAPDADSAAIATANASLVNRSSGGKFLAKKSLSNTAPTALPIVDPTDRKLAFEALFTELMDESKPEVDRALEIKTIPPLMDAAKKLGDIRGVELASTGKDDRSKDLLTNLAKHAEKLMTDALKKLETDMATIDKSASKRVRQTRARGANGADMMEGLTPDSTNQLQSMATTARQISEAAVQMESTFGEAGDFKSVESDATKSFEKANELLKKYDKPPVI